MTDAVADPAGCLPISLPDETWHLEGRLLEASNLALRMVAAPLDALESAASTGSPEAPESPESSWEKIPRAVYKPASGERPLEDFPAHTLAHREVAAWIVADVGGWRCIPETRWFTGEFGEGSLQRWVGPLQPEEQNVVALLEPVEFEREDDWYGIAAFDTDDGPLVLAHRDDDRLRTIAALDLVLNNADRKGSHIISTPTGLYAIDNGLSFHEQEKVRTVLWGWSGRPLGEEIIGHLDRLISARSELDEHLTPHLTAPEIDALHHRVQELRAAGTFPEPPAERYGLPWPPL